MNKLDEILKSLAKIPGAEALAKQALAESAALAASLEEVDSLTASAGASKKAIAALTKERDAFKRDLDAGAAGKDDALKAALRERDEAKAAAEKAGKDLGLQRKREALGEALGIVDAKRRRFAVDTLLPQLPEDVVLDEAGRLVGATKAIKTFREEAPFFWSPADADPLVAEADRGNGGKPAGAGRPPIASSGPGRKDTQTRDEKISKWDKLMGRAPKPA